jgi:hypothetical protein
MTCPCLIRAEHYKLGVREVSASDLTEIDTLEELAALDPGYQKYLQEGNYE